MVEFYGEGVSKLSSDTIVKNLKLPKTLIKSNKRSCDIIQVSYELKIEGQVLGFHLDIDFNFTIAMGSIPFAVTKTDEDSAENNFPGASAPAIDRESTFEYENFAYFNAVLSYIVPPPSFNEAMSILGSNSNGIRKKANAMGFGWAIPGVHQTQNK